MKDSTRVDYQARMGTALRWLSEHQRDDVTPADVAKAVALSPFHFHRIFRGITGESVMQCVRRLRLEAGARQLRHSDVSIISAALDAGYASHEAFTRAFREHFGEPPDVWRKHQRAHIETRVAATKSDITVEVRRSAAIPFLFQSHRSSYADVAAAWQVLVTDAINAGIYNGPLQLVGRYPDDPEITPPGKVRFDVGMVLKNAMSPPPPSFLFDTLAPGRWAVTVHTGSYTTLNHTYLQLVGGWITQHGYGLDDRPCLEFYLNSPADTEESALRTEIWAPLV
jgi:AraC family transcriptional regulator